MMENPFENFTMNFSDVIPTTAEDSAKSDSNISFRMLANRMRKQTRRVQSEISLEKELPWHWEQGMSYHCISAGDVDALTYVRVAIKQQKIRYALLATYSMAVADIYEVQHWVRSGYVGRLDVYVGERFLSKERERVVGRNELTNICRESGGRLVISRMHAKVSVLFGEKFDCVIAGSANLNDNPCVEEMIITVDSELAKFYKDFFDEIKSFERNFDEVKPWQPEN